MKCPKCHKEVEKGSLYCPYCLAEIPWVREFSTVETLMKKEQQNRPSEKKQKTEIIKYFKHPKRRKLKFSRKQLLCLLLCAATLLGFFCYRQLNTFSALYSRAKKQYAQQNYEEAQRIAENALDKNPKNEAANLLLAKSMEKSGDKRSALLVLRPFIQNKIAGTGIYKEYVKLLTQEGKTNEVRLILKSADREVQNACAEYICETPVSNPAPSLQITPFQETDYIKNLPKHLHFILCFLHRHLFPLNHYSQPLTNNSFFLQYKFVLLYHLLIMQYNNNIFS